MIYMKEGEGGRVFSWHKVEGVFAVACLMKKDKKREVASHWSIVMLSIDWTTMNVT